jgi:hypothetical protein
MTPWDWLAPSTASRTRVSYTGRRGGALVVEFELDALAAGDVLDRHLAERRRLVTVARSSDKSGIGTGIKKAAIRAASPSACALA